ncbi:nitrite/sulfite reductase [Chitinilyticum piscinae]|uniref:Nitrite/sulfite reductase n=1 Tax=Chitinilyticum piscinae TaxID=2866724 RepID=A0A8J7FI15_9NEIS|nr:nitrite/sulfite reductase [Chitinilyticum piscinae]MBE9608595.1 nitrite/sulfite reductase [Chitinilyticum piscinae]
MYIYDEYDQKIVDQRVAQYRDQTRRYLAGELTDDEFRPLRLQNGLYIQRHAPMLRVAIPYGNLTSRQVRKLAELAAKYDKGYVHFTTRQNVQYNWPALENVPEMLAELASVQMHAIQTSGNCIRNTTSDQFAGVAYDEIVDPRPWCEIIRQWSTFHPEFAHLPRKFKIAVNGAKEDRAAIMVHDIGITVKLNAAGQVGFEIYVGGGLGRTPMIGDLIKPWLEPEHLLTYLDAVLRVYNRYGRRDNKYKARIKILVKAMTPEAFAAKVEQEWAHLKSGPQTLTDEEIARNHRFFTAPAYETLQGDDPSFLAAIEASPAFSRWVDRNVFAHKVPGYAAVTLSLKKHGVPPGDATVEQLEAVAELADRFSFGELRVSHGQNLILADVKESELFALWEEAKRIGFATPNIGLLTDLICCPGGDFCSLANAKSIPVAKAIQERFDELDYLFDLGEIDVNISGCINACGHHHIGNIGILGVDKNNAEFYQITLGGRQGADAQIGKVIGPSFAQEEMADVMSKIIQVFVENREADERFIDTFDRIGADPFKNKVYEGKPAGKAKKEVEA